MYYLIMIKKELDRELEILIKHKLPVVLTSDFNINVRAENHLHQSYINTITPNGFELLSRKAARITGVAGTCIAHLIGTIIEELYVKIFENECFSDHCSVLFQLKLKKLI